MKLTQSQINKRSQLFRAYVIKDSAARPVEVPMSWGALRTRFYFATNRAVLA